MAEFEDTMTKKVGGVPVWGIATGVGALVIGAAYYLNSRDDGMVQTVYSPDDLQPEETDPNNQDIGLPNGPIGDWLSENPGHPAYPVGIGGGLPAPITNEQWGRFVADQMLGRGNDPSLVNTAIRKYLDGQGLTVAEQAIIRLAISLYGNPPEGVLPIISAGSSPTTPSTTSGPPKAPTTTVSINNLGIATIKWTHSEGATSYIVYGGPVGSGTVSSRVITNHLTHTYLWTGMQKGKTYAFSVAARNAAGYNISPVVNAKRP